MHSNCSYGHGLHPSSPGPLRNIRSATTYTNMAKVRMNNVAPEELNLKTYFLYHQLQHSEILCSAHNAFMCFAWISEQTAIFFSLYRINLSDFITEEECLLRGTNWVFKSDRYNFVLKGMVRNWTHRIATTSYVIISL